MVGVLARFDFEVVKSDLFIFNFQCKQAVMCYIIKLNI